MRILLTLFFLLSFAIPVIAQSDITYLIPYSGEEHSTASLYSDAAVFPIGDSGNQNWDFSAINTWFSATEACSAPYMNTGASNFPNTNIVRSDILNGPTFYNIEATVLLLYGHYNFNDQVIYFNPMMLYSLPLSYGSSTPVDTFSGTHYNSNGNRTTGTARITNEPQSNILGTAFTTYDGYGSIKTNNGTFDNVIRLKTHIEQIETFISSSHEENTTQDIYSWYTSNGKIIFRIIDTHSNTSPYREFFSYTLPETTSISHKRETTNISLCPNPVNDELMIDTKSLPEDHYSVLIYDITGNIVLQESFFLASGESMRIEVSSLTQGLYTLLLGSDNSLHSTKFVKR